jgi:hypothetical protein
MTSTRRRFLKYGLGGVVLLAAPAVGLGLRPTVQVAAPGPLRALDARQYSVLVAVADTLCPGGGGLPSAGELGVAWQLDGLFARMDPSVASDLGGALLLLDNALAGAVLDQRLQTFTGCSPADRARVLDDWRRSGIEVRRAVFKALRGFVMAAYWGDRRTWAHTGYPGMPDYTAVPSPPPFDEWIGEQP